MSKQKNISTNLEYAHQCEKEHDLTGARDFYGFAVTECLSLGVSAYPNKDQAVAIFSQYDLVNLLEKVAEINTLLLNEVATGKYSPSVIGGTYILIVFTQLCWLLRAYELGHVFLNFASIKGIQKTSTKFWAEFYRAINHFANKESYDPIALPLRGLEKYWAVYLPVISDVTNSRDAKASVAEMESSFDKRNKDKRIKDDIYEIEGTIWCLAKWDFRGESILLYASEIYGVNLS
jgi:hypothetical protein